MGDNILEERIWREYEKEYLVRWFYGVGKVWQPIGEVPVLKCVNRLQAVHHARYPEYPPRSTASIVRQLSDLKEEYKLFYLFISLPDIRFDVKHNIVKVGPRYWDHTAKDKEPRDYWRFRKYGMFDFEERQFLFDGGCLDGIDYDWLEAAAAGADPRWLGQPFA